MMNAAIGSALPTYFDYFQTDTPVLDGARRFLSVPLPQTAASAPPGQQPCTLSFGHTMNDIRDLRWFWETEGLPSLSGDGSIGIFPCHTSPVGASPDSLLSDAKTIAILRRNGSVDTSIRFAGFTGMRGSATGLRQAATVDGSEFWLGGIASFEYGVRYLPSARATRSIRILGQTVYPDGRYQPATVDLRSLSVYGSQVYMTSAFLTEPNRNGPAWPYTPWGGIERVGSYGALARTSTNLGTLLRGWSGRKNYHGFAFDANQVLWILEDGNVYEPVTADLAAAHFQPFALSDDNLPADADSGAAAGSSSNPLRPIYRRKSLATSIVRWAWNNNDVAWAEDAAVPRVTIMEALYTLVVRQEVVSRAAGTSMTVIYTVARKALYRVVPSQGTSLRLALAAPGQQFRGIMAAPDYSAGFSRSMSPTPFPTKSASATDTPPKSRTPSRTQKPRY